MGNTYTHCRTGERCTRYWFAGRNGGFLIDHVKYVPPVLRHPPGKDDHLKRELLCTAAKRIYKRCVALTIDTKQVWESMTEGADTGWSARERELYALNHVLKSDANPRIRMVLDSIRSASQIMDSMPATCPSSAQM